MQPFTGQKFSKGSNWSGNTGTITSVIGPNRSVYASNAQGGSESYEIIDENGQRHVVVQNFGVNSFDCPWTEG